MATTTTRFAWSEPAAGDNVSLFQGTFGTTLDSLDAALIGLQGAYSAGTTYHQGDVVTSGGVYYMSTTTQSAAAPPGANWVQMGATPGLYSAAVATAGTTTSTSYVATLTTAGATPSVNVTVTPNGILKISGSAQIALSGSSTLQVLGTYALSGTNTLAAADNNGGGRINFDTANSYTEVVNMARVWYSSGLTAGATTVQMYWKTNAGTTTATISNQVLIVEAY